MSEVLTTQLVYERTRKYFKEGGAWGFDTNTNSCVYRGDAVRTSKVRCSVGLHIPDALYDSRWDRGGGVTIGMILADEEMGELFSEVDTMFLDRMQQVHDDHAKRVLNEYSEDYSLSDASARVQFVNHLDLLAKEYELAVVTA